MSVQQNPTAPRGAEDRGESLAAFLLPKPGNDQFTTTELVKLCSAMAENEGMPQPVKGLFGDVVTRLVVLHELNTKLLGQRSTERPELERLRKLEPHARAAGKALAVISRMWIDRLAELEDGPDRELTKKSILAAVKVSNQIHDLVEPQPQEPSEGQEGDRG